MWGWGGRERDGEKPRQRRKKKKGKRNSTDCPPKSCMPSRAKTTMKRKSRNSKLMMDFIELRRDTTRFLREAQYLTETDTRRALNIAWRRLCRVTRKAVGSS